MQRGAGAGDVEALEALADRAKNRTAVEPEPGLVQDQILKRAVVQPQLAEIHPDKVSSLGLDHAQLRQAGVDKFAHVRDILHKIGFHCIVPNLTAAVGGFGGDQPGGVELAVAAGIVGTAELCPQGIVRNKNVGDLQPRNVERLAGRGGRDGKRRKRGVDRRKHLMTALPDEIGVDLIAEHGHAAALADRTDLQQFFAAPHAPHGVVGAAQQEQFYIILNDLTLKIRKINFIMPGCFIQYQIAGNQLAAIIRNDLAERIVHRLLDEHGVPRLGAGLDRYRDGKHHAGRFLQPCGLHLPAVMCGHPLLHGGKVVVVRLGVAVNCMLCLTDERILDIRGNFKVHIRHPQGQHIRRAVALDGEIIFQAFGAAPVNDSVKIQIAFTHGCLLAHRAAKARAKSAVRSLMFSMPTDRRRMRSVRPLAASTSGGTSACVWVMG